VEGGKLVTGEPGVDGEIAGVVEGSRWVDLVIAGVWG